MTDIVEVLRTLARLMETKAPVTFREQDAAHLREAIDQIECLRAALQAVVDAKDNPELMRARVIAHDSYHDDFDFAIVASESVAMATFGIVSYFLGA